MLVEFSVGNYRSFKEKVTFSMVAANISSRPSWLDEQNVFNASADLKLLTSAAIYGANASGKSNLVAALRFMRRFVLGSSRDTQITEAIPVEPFLLSVETEAQPSHFEIVFRVDETQYRYGFEADKQQVATEWLYRLSSSRESLLFTRDGANIKVNPRNFREGRGLEERTRRNALFLSVVAQFNGAVAKTILLWFRSLAVNAGVNDAADLFLAAYHAFEKSLHRKAIEQLIKRLDVGIESIAMERIPATIPGTLPPEAAQQMRSLFDALASTDTPAESIEIKTFHRRFDAQGQEKDTVEFNLQEHESAGTQRLFALAYPLMDTLREGRVLVIDELDARIHPNLVIALIRLFHSPKTNPRHAQLIFTTHNTNLLSARLFRRDQIWFVEKSRQGASDIYSLVEYRTAGKVVRNDASFENDYIAGRYGAIPFIDDLSELLGTSLEQTTV